MNFKHSLFLTPITIFFYFNQAFAAGLPPKHPKYVVPQKRMFCKAETQAPAARTAAQATGFAPKLVISKSFLSASNAPIPNPETTLIECQTRIKKAAEQKLLEEEINLHTFEDWHYSMGHSFEEARYAYNELKSCKPKTAEFLWHRCNEYNQIIFDRFTCYYKMNISCLMKLSFALWLEYFASHARVKNYIQSVRTTFDYNPWYRIKSHFESFSHFLTGSTFDEYMRPIMQQCKHTIDPESFNPLQAEIFGIFANLEPIITNLEHKIDKQNEYDCIDTFINITELYDELNQLLNLDFKNYAKKRMEYQQLAQKHGKETAAAS